MGRPIKIFKGVPDAIRKEIEEAIRAPANIPAIDIYRRFSLVDRGVKESAFYCHVRRIRERMQVARDTAPVESPKPEGSLEKTIRSMNRTVSAMDNCIETADYEALTPLAKAASALAIVAKHSLYEAANKRADEIHQAKMHDLKKAIRADIENKTEGGKTLTREEVYDAIDKAMRGEL